MLGKHLKEYYTKKRERYTEACVSGNSEHSSHKDKHMRIRKKAVVIDSVNPRAAKIEGRN